jgi:hypothetical protein
MAHPILTALPFAVPALEVRGAEGLGAGPFGPRQAVRISASATKGMTRAEMPEKNVEGACKMEKGRMGNSI